MTTTAKTPIVLQRGIVIETSCVSCKGPSQFGCPVANLATSNEVAGAALEGMTSQPGP